MSTQIQNAINAFTNDLTNLIRASAREMVMESVNKLELGPISPSRVSAPRVRPSRARRSRGADISALVSPQPKRRRRSVLDSSTVAKVRQTLVESNGNVSEVSRRLGISRKTIAMIRGKLPG